MPASWVDLEAGLAVYFIEPTDIILFHRPTRGIAVTCRDHS
jgi:hypothetical protein